MQAKHDADATPVRARSGGALPRLRTGLVWLLLLLAAPLLIIGPELPGLARKPLAVDATASQRSAIPCLSYAPFRRPGHDPADAQLRISPAQIEDDLRRLRGFSRCVRSYGIDHGLEALPAVARALGMRVLLGVWIDRDPVGSRAQLQRGIALAHAHADVIDLLVVGNEVLLRREMSPQALAQLLSEARRDSPVPVAYADVWAFWASHAAQLRDSVDVAAIHILPYWEDVPIGVEAAVGHLHAVLAQMRDALAPLPVLVAETGWPVAGRQRGPAQPGFAQQQRFLDVLLARAPNPAMPGLPAFNWIEAFDQPWKRQHEGTVGGWWGLLDAKGELRSGDPMDWRGPARGVVLGAALAGGIVGGIAGAMAGGAAGDAAGGAAGPGTGTGRTGAFTRRLAQQVPAPPRTRRVWLAGLIGGAMIGLLLAIPAAWQIQLQMLAGLDGLRERMQMAVAALAWLTALPLAWQLLQALLGQAAKAHKPSAASQTLLAFLLAMLLLQLIAEGRYRPLLWPVFVAPVGVLVGLAVLGLRVRAVAGLMACGRLFAWLCVLLVPGLLLTEGMRNQQAWWLALSALLAGVSILRVLSRA